MINLLVPIAIGLVSLITGCSVTPTTANKERLLTTDLQKSSYAQGVQHMKTLLQYDTPLDQDAFLMGMNDVLNKHKIRLSSEQLQKGLAWVFVQQVSYNEKVAPINLAKGKAFLEINKQKPGIITLSSGLQYKILIDGNGKRKPTLKDTAYLRYRIMLIDGTELTSNIKETKTQQVKVNNLIKGWQEALLLMTEGAKWQLFIPSELAYGEAGAPEGRLEPNETLIYDVELVDLQSPSSAKP